MSTDSSIAIDYYRIFSLFALAFVHLLGFIFTYFFGELILVKLSVFPGREFELQQNIEYLEQKPNGFLV